MSSYRSRLLLLSAAFVVVALVAPPADAQVRVIERYFYLAFVGPQLPPHLADVTGECITECDGTYWCWGYRAPWMHNWAETFVERCGPIYYEPYASLNSSKVFQMSREKYARGAAAMRVPMRKCAVTQMARLSTE